MLRASAARCSRVATWRPTKRVLETHPVRTWRVTSVEALRTMSSNVTTTSKRTMAQAAQAVADGEKYKPIVNIAQDKKPVYQAMDGCQAAAHVAYALSDISFIYPISPATPMGDYMDNWASAERQNIFGQVVDVNMMQSEGGAAGALHGAAAAGALSSTFTASQGLLLMIPNMYLLAGELVPTVFHVSARTVAKHALSIFNDHSDVMACRQTGFAMLCSSSVQEVMDMALVSHVASLKSRLPFMHFFDGYRTSSEISKIQPIPYADMAKIFPDEDAQKNLRDFALNPNKPMIRGTGQRPDIFFQSTVAAQKFYNACPDIVEDTMREVESITGRKYHLFDYHGSPNADKVIVIMGSGAKTVEETVDYMNSRGENVGVVTVRLFRPWSAWHFLHKVPKSAKKIAVLDRTREDGAIGMPLFLDVNVSFSDAGEKRYITGGQYGLASKEFTPEMVEAVFKNLDAKNPKQKYVIGINDDVTDTSIPFGAPLNTLPEGTKQVMFWGLGSDGTVGASKEAIRVIGENTDLKAQGHFVYDSHKADGVTISHVRFGPSNIKAEYEINQDADYVSCNHPSYPAKFDQILNPLKQGGTFVLNSPWVDFEEMDIKMPSHMKNKIAEKELEFYNIDANKLAQDLGLGKRINMIMQAAFYKLSGVLPEEKAIELLRQSIEKTYSRKGPKVVDMNNRAVDATGEYLKKVDYPASWRTTTRGGEKDEMENAPEFVSKVMDPVLALQGDSLPVSAFEPGGHMPIGTTSFEKRGIAPNIPVWKPDNCTQCNYCAIVCPHAVVRPFLLDKEEMKSAPRGFEARKAKGGQEVAGYHYTIQISPFDCTGCEVCVESCPDDALFMSPFNDVAEGFKPHWDYAIQLPEREEIGDKYTIKGSQFQKPLMEFSGACAGCGETPYMKLATQLFGDRMVIANSSGCSSVWGGTATTIPFTTNNKGRGPAWGRSLFEDTAEYGFGMMIATRQRRRKLEDHITAVVNEDTPMSPELKDLFQKWLKNIDNADACTAIGDKIEERLKVEKDSHPALRNIWRQKDLLHHTSHWFVGGDGWAYDIGYGGLDHILSKGENVNILVLDTEMYSNTGGQVSKSTQLSTVTKFAASGKAHVKKDLGMAAMMYENVYVASVALGANMSQTVTAFKEAESYNGTSLIIAYSPCIDWGIEMKDMMDEQKKAVESGYWTLYRYDPRNRSKGQNPLSLDSRRLKGDLKQFLHSQNRFQQLVRKNEEHAKILHSNLSEVSLGRHDKFKRLAMDDEELLEHLKERLGEEVTTEKNIVLYGSETGNAASLAAVFGQELKRRGIRAKVMAMDDFDFDDLPKQNNVYCVVATCGQGEFPGNCKGFWELLNDQTLPPDYLQNTNFGVFGMGDESYVFFNTAAKEIDRRLGELGGKRILPMGLGNDKDEERYETKWNDWLPDLWNELGTPPPPMELLPPTYNVTYDTEGIVKPPDERIIPWGTKLVPLTKNELLSPPDYERDIRHYEVDLSGKGMSYSVGESLAVYPHNDPEEVNEWLHNYDLNGDWAINLEDTQMRKEPLPEMTSIRRLFTEVLDIFGRPARRFYETLSIAARDEDERSRLQHLLSKEGQEELRNLQKETVTYAELMEQFPSSRLSLEYLVDHIPRIKPRLYSIASSSEMRGDMLHMCIVLDDWKTPTGKYKKGMCTRYLQHLSEDGEIDLLASKVNAAGITIPDSQKPPYVMVGLGTGLAPLRAMIEEREVARQRGETVGEMALFFGARYKRNDYTYGDELEEYHSNGKGVLTVLSNAFSRDQAHKIYVQDRINENPEIIYDYLIKKKGYFYLCGPAGNVPESVRKGIVNAIVKCGGHKEEEADQMVTQMQIEGRYNIEAW